MRSFIHDPSLSFVLMYDLIYSKGCYCLGSARARDEVFRAIKGFTPVSYIARHETSQLSLSLPFLASQDHLCKFSANAISI